MRTCHFIWALLVAFVAAPDWAAAQARVNPDISAVGDMRYIFRDGTAKTLADSKTTTFLFEELELAFVGHLNPYARADVFLAIPGIEGIEIEEGYASIVRGLPLQFRFGKFYLDFGQVNPMHIHQMAWLRRPIVLDTFFSLEGANVIGLRAYKLFGIGDTAFTLSGNAFRSDFFEPLEEEGGLDPEATEGGIEGPVDIGGSGRLDFFRELTPTTFLTAGGSYLYSTYEQESGLKAQVGGIDAKLKWIPDTYRRIEFLVDFMVSDREVETDTLGTIGNVTATGAFSALEVQFRRRWDTGAFFDWAQDPLDSDIATTSGGAWLAFMPAEETVRFSAVYRYTESDRFEGSANELTLQVIFSLGPHKPHKF